ncbi:MAG: phosphatidylglycerophosphatase A, partial [Geminicoccaceae bacterium]
LLPATPLAYLLGFVLFRILDMAKPWPADWIDRRMTGGVGVMLDDVVAGIYAGALALLALSWLP